MCRQSSGVCRRLQGLEDLGRVHGWEDNKSHVNFGAVHVGFGSFCIFLGEPALTLLSGFELQQSGTCSVRDEVVASTASQSESSCRQKKGKKIGAATTPRQVLCKTTAQLGRSGKALSKVADETQAQAKTHERSRRLRRSRRTAVLKTERSDLTTGLSVALTFRRSEPAISLSPQISSADRAKNLVAVVGTHQPHRGTPRRRQPSYVTQSTISATSTGLLLAGDEYIALGKHAET